MNTITNTLMHRLFVLALTMMTLTGLASAQKMGYVWANDPTSASYAPSTLYASNGGNGSITVDRTGVGHYRVRFAGLGGNTPGGNVQVSAYGESNETCKIVSWGNSGQDVITNVRCFRPGGAPVDTQYSLSVSK